VRLPFKEGTGGITVCGFLEMRYISSEDRKGEHLLRQVKGGFLEKKDMGKVRCPFQLTSRSSPNQLLEKKTRGYFPSCISLLRANAVGGTPCPTKRGNKNR